jgi:hypothetical protein
MRNLKSDFGIGVLMSFILLSTVSLVAAEPKTEGEGPRWENLQTLASGQSVRVVLNNMESHDGKFLRAGEQALTVRMGNGEQTFARQDILRVSANRPPHRARNALIGLAAGAAVGLGIAARAESTDPEQSMQYCVDPIVLGALGAGAGVAFSRGGWHDVYRAH